METTTSTPSAPFNTPKVRSTFLTVLCVLTFIGSGWGVIQAVKSYITADSMAAVTSEAMSDVQDKLDQQQGTPSFVKSIMGSISGKLSADNIRKSSIFELLSRLLTLFGAIMMWNLRKTGFYLYIGGIIVGIAGTMIVFGTGTVALIGSAGAGFIGVVFIALYAANLKDMNS